MPEYKLVRVDANLPLQCFQSKETGNWIGICEPMKITVQSDTWAHLMEDVDLAVNAMFQDLSASP